MRKVAESQATPSAENDCSAIAAESRDRAAHYEDALQPDASRNTTQENGVGGDKSCQPSALGRLRARLIELSMLEAGWLDGEGYYPTHAARALAGKVLEQAYGMAGVPEGRLYPCADSGGVQAEWDIGEWAAEAWFAPSGRVMRLAATRTIDDTLRWRVDHNHAAHLAAFLDHLAGRLP